MELTVKSCCLTGHRAEKLPWGYDESDPRCLALKQRLSDILLSLYESGCRHFICGMATGCDLYFGEAVVALRAEKPDMTLEAAIPYEGQSERWDAPARQRYFRLAEECDTRTVLHHSYTPDCMMDRNRYMVDHADVLIAVYGGDAGGTQSTMLYAMRTGKQIIELTP